MSVEDHSDETRDADERQQSSVHGSRRRRRPPVRETLVVVVCVLILTWTLQTFVGRQYVIPSESMETTLNGCDGCTNDRIVIDKLIYRFRDPAPGDVVVFKGPTQGWNDHWKSPRSTNAAVRGLQNGLSWFGFAPPDENDLVKRVIATGGQTVECHADDHVGVTVNGVPLRERYIDTELQQRGGASGNVAAAGGLQSTCLGPDFGPISVAPGNVWVMGDNRVDSRDSRYHLTDGLQGTVPMSDIRGKVRLIIYPFSRAGLIPSANPQHR